MSLWDLLPETLRDSGSLDGIKDSLEAVDDSVLIPTTITEPDGSQWSVRTLSVDVPELLGLQLDSATGRFAGDAGPDSTALEFSSETLQLSLGLRLTAGVEDGSWFLDLDTPGLRVAVPYLRGAKLDSTGQLVADPAHPQVRFLLPRLVVRINQLDAGPVGVKLKSATISGTAVNDVYTAIAMSPPHALVGPGDVVGFAFRTAVLDLSSEAGPPDLPPEARSLPDAWQGLHLPEVRLFVAPNGLKGLAVSAGTRNLWIGFGEHAGVTGIFSAVVINRGAQPVISGRFITAGGRHIAAVPGGSVEVPDGSLLLVDTAGGVAPIRVRITEQGGAAQTVDRMTVHPPKSYSVTATDALGHASAAVVFSTAVASAETTPSLGESPATIVALTPETGRIRIASQSSTSVTVALESGLAADWTWPGGTSANATTATVDVPAGGNVDVTAEPATQREVSLDCYFKFARPSPGQEGTRWPFNPDQTSSAPATSRTGFGNAAPFISVATDRRASIGTTPLVIDGYASFEVTPGNPDRNDNATHRAYNMALSQRRMEATLAVLTDLGYSVTLGSAHGHESARDQIAPAPGLPTPEPGSSHWWRARAHSVAEDVEIRARLEREASIPPGEVVPRDEAPAAPQRPDCFLELGVEVELIRNTFVRCELWGKFDIQTTVENSLDAGGQPPLGGAANPGDGQCMFRVRLRIATDGNAWETMGEFRAMESDLDGLVRRRRTDPGVDPAVLDVLGALVVLGPLSAQAAELSPAAGALVQLGSLALGASSVIQTKVISLYGAELLISDGIIAPDGSTTTDRGTQIGVMLDVEVEFWFDLAGIIQVPEDRPIKVRYKAIGVRSTWDTGGPDQYLPIPVFDPTRGYSLDIQPGSVRAKPPLDEILQIFGVRVSRDNPTWLEVELGISVPLGPLTVESVRVRARTDALEPPQLTKLAASLDIPGTLHGSGSVELTDAGFKATFDLTIVPLSVRAVATLAIETRNGVTGVLIGIEVEFPVPIPLGNSGLGIYGAMGGIGINYQRLEDATATVPALAWLMQQFGASRNSVMHPDGWVHSPGSYAFAAGILLGTSEGGFVVHLKGIVIIEIPGPRLLLVMKADVLKMPPALTGNRSATFLAVLDIDFGRGTISLGLVAGYTIEKILDIRVPVSAFFDTREPEKWLVHLGSYADRVTVKVLGVISATGYLMVQGNGISIPVLPAVPSGIAIATGFHFQAVLMGSKAARLYVEVAAGFDAILGFDPFFLAGKVYLRGELMLFIVSISVSAELEMVVGKRKEIVGGVEVVRDNPWVHGKVCGKVSFFFFSVQGCCELEIGGEPDPMLEPVPLVAGVTLISRSPALVEGSGTQRQIDGSLGEAHDVDGPSDAATPSVPLDAIPVLRFEVPPDVEGLAVMGTAPVGTTGVAGVSAWHRIGDRWWAYQVTAVGITGVLGAGEKPSTWWLQGPSDASDAHAALALLNWLPTPFPRAVTYGKNLRSQVEHRWGTVCDPVAPPAELFWTFAEQGIGPDPVGWLLPSSPWPDPPAVRRNRDPRRELLVDEPWRSGNAAIDLLQGTDPALVLGDVTVCPDGAVIDPQDPLKSWRNGDPFGSEPTMYGSPLQQVDVMLNSLGSTTLADLPAYVSAQATDPELTGVSTCQGRVLRSPMGTSDKPAPRGSPENAERVQKFWEGTGHKSVGLMDAVRLSVREPFEQLTVLIDADVEEARQLDVVVRSRGDEVERLVVGDFPVSASNPLPPRWVDVSGPWAAPLTTAGRVVHRLPGDAKRHRLFLVEVKAGDEVLIGRRHDRPGRAFHVVAISALVTSEVEGHSWDETVRTRDQESLQTGLDHDPSDHALLAPDTSYEVAVTWEFAMAEGASRPTTAPAFANPRTQRFTFVSDPMDPPSSRPEDQIHCCPRDLGPWLLDTSPGMGDDAVFCHEPLRVVFATQNVTALFAAYGRRLEATVRSASGHHPRPPGGGAPGSPVAIPLQPIALVDATADDILVTHENSPVGTPFDEMVRDVVNGRIDPTTGERGPALPCIDTSGMTRTTSELRLTYHLEPLTDYIFDIESVPISGAGDRVRVYRANFTTSRFDTVADLVSWLAPVRTEHRLVRNVAPIASLPARPTGDEYDAGVQLAGLPVPQLPSAPRVEIWWNADPVPQPVAVVVESSEALYSTRIMPTQVVGPHDAQDPEHVWWAARRQPWLELLPTSTPPDPTAEATVTGAPVVAPGGTRVLFRLATGMRGTRLALDLVQALDPFDEVSPAPVRAVDITLDGAPWEVTD